ncbi:hypothetical protein TNCT_130841 [Trichonephila clavata]|uniref:Uncharacterized protein n=1 Tax=Trichonephila clavata TaxID=2740835 RepID=A0A8X6EY87_TRICU|nr:hypothetical protein TNCT_130841 [Trichonephila clavata]
MLCWSVLIGRHVVNMFQTVEPERSNVIIFEYLEEELRRTLCSTMSVERRSGLFGQNDREGELRYGREGEAAIRRIGEFFQRNSDATDRADEDNVFCGIMYKSLLSFAVDGMLRGRRNLEPNRQVFIMAGLGRSWLFRLFGKKH